MGSSYPPLPDNARLFSSVQDALLENFLDWILAHNIHDLLDARISRFRKSFLSMNLSGRILQDQSTISRELYLKNLQIFWLRVAVA